MLFEVPDPEAEKGRDERGSHARSCEIMRTVEDRTEQLFLCQASHLRQGLEEADVCVRTKKKAATKNQTTDELCPS